LHWQSVIVCPERASWMHPPDVPADPRFAWWRRLRDVQSSWVSSRGEAERFLYYDGPTRAAVPVSVSLDEPLGLHFTKAPVDAVIPGQSGEQGQSGTSANSVARGGLPEHEGLYIQVKSDQIGGMYLDRISSAAVAVPGQ